ncbi:MAG: cyclic nucleotide-binding domain-containing protein [bacterium]|nr:cyclic nucleotide-binding domain-containing protein [bacterium]
MIDTKILEKIGVFDGLSSPELQVLAKIITIKKYRKGEVLFEQGDQRRSFFIVLSGKVHIYRVFENEVQTLAFLGKDNFAVESALTGPKLKHQHNGEVMEEGDLIEIRGKDFIKLAEDYPQIVSKVYANVIANLDLRLHHANNKLMTIFTTSKVASTYEDLDHLTDLVLTTILQIIKANRAAFVLFHPDEDRIQIYDARGYENNQFMKNLKIGLKDDPILGLVYKSKREVVVTKEMYRKQKSLRAPYSVETMLAAPLIMGERVIGAIFLGEKDKGRDFSYNNQILLNIIALQIVMPIALAEKSEEAPKRK